MLHLLLLQYCLHQQNIFLCCFFFKKKDCKLHQILCKRRGNKNIRVLMMEKSFVILTLVDHKKKGSYPFCQKVEILLPFLANQNRCLVSLLNSRRLWMYSSVKFLSWLMVTCVEAGSHQSDLLWSPATQVSKLIGEDGIFKNFLEWYG